MATNNILSVIPFVSSRGGLPPEEVTFAEILKENGYKTGLIGKWHLGVSCSKLGDNCHHPLNQGFDYYYGVPLSNFADLGRQGERSLIWEILPHMTWFRGLIAIVTGCVIASVFLRMRGHIKTPVFLCMVLIPLAIFGMVCFTIDKVRIWNSVIMRNFDFVEQQFTLDNINQRLIQEGVEFLEERKEDQEPFLLFMSWLQVHTALFVSNENFRGKSAHGLYGDNVEEMDWGTGQILKALKQYGLDENTIVYFTSDNGGHIEHHEKGERAGGHNGIYKGGKSQGGMEGGIRMPSAIMWPAKIPAGSIIETPTSQMDILPTLTKVIGVNPPTDRVIDGQDMTSLLFGESKVSSHEFLFHYCGIWLHAARWIPPDSTAIWKVHYATPDWAPGHQDCRPSFVCSCLHVTWRNPPLLFNIEDDPTESKPYNVSAPEYREIVQKINDAKRKHEKSLKPVPCQLSAYMTFFRPWLQPCCNFPYCNCRDKKYVT